MDLITGFLEFVAICLAPLVVVLVVRRAPAVLPALHRLLVRCHLWPRPPERPVGPPLEELAADLRRLYPNAHHPRSGQRMPKQRGCLMAYDERLVETARALQVPTTLTDLPIDAVEREAERMRVELLLCDAGVVWQARADWPERPAA